MMKKSAVKRGMAVALGLLVCSGLVTGCGGSKVYPSKDIQFYISADAGGGTDGIARKITQIIEANPDTETKFYMVNKPGVNDAVASSLCMDAKPDGYTICNGNYSSSVSAEYNQVVDNYSMDRLKTIALVTEESDAIMVSKNAPFQTFEAMIEYAKANPGTIKVADQGIGSRVYLLLNKLEDEYGIEFNKISYSSSAPQREAMLNGEVDMALTSLGDFSSVLQSGDALGICEFSSVRNAAYTDVPTCIELGLDESYLSGSFLFIAAPAETPDEITDYIQAEFEKAVQSDEFKEWTATVGVTPHYLTGTEVKEYIANLQEKDFKALDDLKAQGLIQ